MPRPRIPIAEFVDRPFVAWPLKSAQRRSFVDDSRQPPTGVCELESADRFPGRDGPLPQRLFEWRQSKLFGSMSRRIPFGGGSQRRLVAHDKLGLAGCVRGDRHRLAAHWRIARDLLVSVPSRGELCHSLLVGQRRGSQRMGRHAQNRRDQSLHHRRDGRNSHRGCHGGHGGHRLSTGWLHRGSRTATSRESSKRFVDRHHSLEHLFESREVREYQRLDFRRQSQSG